MGRERATDAWVDKYIFPGGYLPDIAQLTRSMAKYDQHPVDFESLRLHYAMTLDEWWRRYETHKFDVIDQYGERFHVAVVSRAVAWLGFATGTWTSPRSCSPRA